MAGAMRTQPVRVGVMPCLRAVGAVLVLVLQGLVMVSSAGRCVVVLGMWPHAGVLACRRVGSAPSKRVKGVHARVPACVGLICGGMWHVPRGDCGMTSCRISHGLLLGLLRLLPHPMARHDQRHRKWEVSPHVRAAICSRERGSFSTPALTMYKPACQPCRAI